MSKLFYGGDAERDNQTLVAFWDQMFTIPAAKKGIQLVDGRMLYQDGVLRLVSRTDEAWATLFAPWFTVESLEHFAWPGETEERRRLFRLRRRQALAA